MEGKEEKKTEEKEEKKKTGVKRNTRNDGGVTRPPTVRVGIIGSANRTALEKKGMTTALFEKMISHAEDVIRKTLRLDPASVTLVSGGAACADHVAIRLWLQEESKWSGLELYVPTVFNSTTRKFSEAKGDGRIANFYHAEFDREVLKNHTGLDEIEAARKKGAIFHVSTKGTFEDRNRMLAQSVDYLIAYTWRSDAEAPPLKGGTRKTWNAFRGSPYNRLHFQLSTLGETATMPPEKGQTLMTQFVSLKRHKPDVLDNGGGEGGGRLALANDGKTAALIGARKFSHIPWAPRDVDSTVWRAAVGRHGSEERLLRYRAGKVNPEPEVTHDVNI